jgi:putative nucleotidyltransferase with HDIG domain
MVSKLETHLPEMSKIKDASLKQKIGDAYEDALKTGGWTFDDLNTIPFTLLIPDTKVSFLKHTQGVLKIAYESAKMLDEFYTEYDIDFDTLIAGAVLHDIGKLLEYKVENGKYSKSTSGLALRHPFSGTALCMKHGINNKILHTIAYHAKEGDGARMTPEAVIINKADFMNFEPLKLV